jgi:hypothetical protein
MEERRSGKRSPTILEGRIVLKNHLSDFECTVLNISETGAQVTFRHSIGIDQEFQLTIPKTGRSERARVAWSKGDKHGLSFIKMPKEEGLGHARNLSRVPRSGERGLPGEGWPDGAEPCLQDILAETHVRIAQAAGVPVETVSLSLEIDYAGAAVAQSPHTVRIYQAHASGPRRLASAGRRRGRRG